MFQNKNGWQVLGNMIVVVDSYYFFHLWVKAFGATCLTFIFSFSFFNREITSCYLIQRQTKRCPQFRGIPLLYIHSLFYYISVTLLSLVSSFLLLHWWSTAPFAINKQHHLSLIHSLHLNSTHRFLLLPQSQQHNNLFCICLSTHCYVRTSWVPRRIQNLRLLEAPQVMSWKMFHIWLITSPTLQYVVVHHFLPFSYAL